MSILVIGDRERAKIKAAIEQARACVNKWEDVQGVADGTISSVLLIKDRKPGVEEYLEKRSVQRLMLGTYRVSFSFEEQPAGVVRHLSISSHHRGKMPGPHVMALVIPEFGFSGMPLKRPGRSWVEEFEPGRFAVNVAEVEP